MNWVRQPWGMMADPTLPRPARARPPRRSISRSFVTTYILLQCFPLGEALGRWLVAT